MNSHRIPSGFTHLYRSLPQSVPVYFFFSHFHFFPRFAHIFLHVSTPPKLAVGPQSFISPLMTRTKYNPLCFLDICTQDFDSGKITYQGRILIETRHDVTPITAENFRALCTGEKGNGVSGTPLHYKNSIFHRVIPGFCTQGGDITKSDGTGGEPIYRVQTGKDYFDDENFKLKHQVYAVAMANSGKNKNSSQFYIFHSIAKHFLDGKHVVFGAVKFGFNVADFINKLGSTEGTTSQHIYIARCGQLHVDQAESFFEFSNGNDKEAVINEAREL